MWRRRRETAEEVEARMAREDAERALRETRARWPAIDSIADLVEEIHSGRNGVAFLDDLAEAMKPRRRKS